MKISFTTHIKNGVDYVRQHPQLLMTIVLGIIIPIAFLVSGQQFLSAARTNQERLEMDRVGIMHDLFSAFLVASNFDQLKVQAEIQTLTRLNPDITKMNVAREDGTEVRIIASLDVAQIDTYANEPNTYRIGNTNPNESLINPYARDGVRYWQSFRLVRVPGQEDHYIFIETSLEHIDTLFAARIMQAYYWLVGLLFVILYLLFRHVRLIDYSYLYREMKKANEMKDLFTNMIAHELRAPLTAMRGYASMIREREGTDDVTKKNALEIESASGRLITIVSDLLDVARIQSGKLHMELGTIHVSGVARSVIEALHPSATEKNIILKVADTYGNLTITGDEKRFYQALTNVVSNAIKYTKEGTITVELTDAKDRIEIRVKDTGMGISSENQKKMFAPFFRVEGEETASITGTGLGMWVTKQIVELMKGLIGVESIKGVGTHVVMTFPKSAKQ
jgi:signal transduction histidine kinase